MSDYDHYTDDDLPVSPRLPEPVIIAVDRWRVVDKTLVKQYSFRREGDREKFVMGLMSYELKVGHNALITIDEGVVGICVTTKDLNEITELDKEYAAHCDSIFKEIAYAPRQENF